MRFVVCYLAAALGFCALAVNAHHNEYQKFLEEEELPLTDEWMINRNSEIARNRTLFEGDILLTDEQRQEMLVRIGADSTVKYWPKATDGYVYVKYRFGDTSVNKTKVKEILALWEASTCIQFTEIPAAENNPHLNFISSAHCLILAPPSSDLEGQRISMDTNCFDSVGRPLQLIGFALGFSSEHVRSDRDNHVYIMWNNIRSYRFDVFHKDSTRQYDVEYDYSSIMNYKQNHHSKNGEDTIVAKVPFGQPLIEQQGGFSFLDLKMANLQYQCMDVFLVSCNVTTDPCQNGGYMGKDCTCVCTPGTSGTNCETKTKSYFEAVSETLAPNNQMITAEGTVTSPGYPAPYGKVENYVQIIEAPESKKVCLTFTEFELRPKSYVRFMGYVCSLHRFTIRRQENLTVSETFCGTNITTNQVFESEGRQLIIYMNSLTNATVKGYSAQVTFVNETSACSPTSPTSCTTPGYLSVVHACGACKRTTLGSVMTITSPRYPYHSPHNSTCSMNFRTNAPRILKITPSAPHFTGRMYFYGVYKTYYRINCGSNNQDFYMSASQSRFYFNGGHWGRTFSVRVQTIGNECHKILHLSRTATGTLQLPDFADPSVKMCEWWLRAPVGKRIKLAVTQYDSGSTSCSQSYVLINYNRGNYLSRYNTMLCRKRRVRMRTKFNVLKVVFNGLWAQRNPSFVATYRVV